MQLPFDYNLFILEVEHAYIVWESVSSLTFESGFISFAESGFISSPI